MAYSRAVKKEEEMEDDESIECIGVLPARNNLTALKLSDSDVLLCDLDRRGATAPEHAGNVAYRKLIDLYKDAYANATSLKDKLGISKSVVASIRRAKGRFLEHEKNPSFHIEKWKEVGDGKATEITLNVLREEPRISSQNDTIVSSSLSASTSPTQSAPAAKAEESTPSPIDPTLLIRLNQEQASCMKYPVGCPIWYNIHLDAPTSSSSQDTSQYSPLGAASVGYVKSISMDIATRNLLYAIVPNISAEYTYERGAGTCEESGREERFVLEEHLYYASKCPVYVQLDEPEIGEIIYCCFSEGRLNGAAKKSYMVTSFLKDNRVQIFQSVSEDFIKYRSMGSETGSIMDQEESEKDERKETMRDNANTDNSQKNVRQNTEQKSGEIGRKETDGALLEEAGQPLESIRSSAPTDLSIQSEGVVSSVTHNTPSLKSTTVVSTVKCCKPINEIAIKVAQAPVKSAEEMSRSKPSMSSTNNRGYCLDPARPSGSQPSRWDPSIQDAPPLSSAPLRKRPAPAAPSSSNEAAETTAGLRQHPSKCHRKNEHKAANKSSVDECQNSTKKNESLRLLATLSNFRNKNSPSPMRKVAQIPSWLVNGSRRHEVIDALNSSIENIYKDTGHKIHIDEREISMKNTTQYSLTVYTHTQEEEKPLKIAVETLENLLVKIIGAEESRGKMLYDIARSNGDIKYDGVVFQRNPLNSSERIWMSVIDLPNQLVQKNLTDIFLDPEFQGNIHDSSCTLVVCKDNLNAKILRCYPHLLILGKQVNCVLDAVALTKSAIKQFKYQAMHYVQNVSYRSSINRPCSFVRFPNWSGNVKKVVIPLWLRTDPLYIKEVEDGLFGSEWCKEREFQACTGCQLIPSQHYLLIRPSSNAQQDSNIEKSLIMIEDALLDFLGASESKCLLLYDLAKSYSKLPVGGFARIRNPLNSKEGVWANVVKPSQNDEKHIISLTTKGMNNEMHRLKCTLKICRECFGIKMRHCEPYVMVMGRCKNNVEKAVDLVEKSIKNHKKRFECKKFARYNK